MADENTEDETLFREVEVGVLQDYEILRTELRRSAEISTGFYEKLAALNAGSIAVSVSIGVAILTKPELRPLSHGLALLILLFWISLLSAVGHNLLATWGARLDVAYSRDEFIRNTLKRLLRNAQAVPGVGSDEMRWLEKELQSPSLKKQKITSVRKRGAETAATVIGGLSICSFLAGYTFVAIGVLKLWLWT